MFARSFVRSFLPFTPDLWFYRWSKQFVQLPQFGSCLFLWLKLVTDKRYRNLRCFRFWFWQMIEQDIQTRSRPYEYDHIPNIKKACFTWLDLQFFYVINTNLADENCVLKRDCYPNCTLFWTKIVIFKSFCFSSRLDFWSQIDRMKF